MVYERLSPRIIAIFGIGALLPLVIGSTIGILLMYQTSTQASDIAASELFTTAQTELNTAVHAEADGLNSFFSKYEAQMIDDRGYLENLLENPLIDSRWNDSLIVEHPGGLKGLSTDVGIGDVLILKDVNLTSSINNTLRSLSSIGNYFNAVVESDTVLLAYLGTEQGVNRFFPYVNLVENVPDPAPDPMERPWYTVASSIPKSDNSSAWSVYQDLYLDKLVSTVSAPLYNGSEFFGVVALDLSLDAISNRISKITYKKSGYAILLDESLTIIAKSNLSSSDVGYNEFLASNNVAAANQVLHDKVQEAIQNNTGQFSISLRTGINQDTTEEKLIFYQKIEKPSVLLCIVVQKSEITEIADQIAQIWENSSGQYLISIFLIIIALLVITFLISFVLFGIGLCRYSLPVELFLSEQRRADILFNLISHDMRNALQSHLFAMEMLNQHHPAINNSIEMDILEKTYQKIEKIGNSILKIGELSFLDRDYVRKNLMDLSEECERVVDQLKTEHDPLGTKAISINFTHESSEKLMCFYNPLLAKALFEIGTNAITYNKKDEKIIKLTLESDNRNAIISITDNGSYIPLNIREILLNPLEYIDRRTGLGYVMLKLATDFSGGHYEIHSDEQEDLNGTKITITIPVTKL
ncbi:MAG: ATP-binding protein [Candidatus Hodarchaeota archaeon]